MTKSGTNFILVGIFVGIVLGLIVGGFAPEVGIQLKFLGDIFLRSLMLMVVPLVMASMIVGVAKLGDIRSLGSIGWRTIVYYMVTTALSVILGLVLVNIIAPGKGITGEEILPNAKYSVQGRTLIIHDAELKRTDYDDRYRLTLLDQGIYGPIDKSKPISKNKIFVQEWLKDVWVPTREAEAILGLSEDEIREQIRQGKLKERIENGKREILVTTSEDTAGNLIIPEPQGTGIKISLPVAARVAGKEKTIFQVLTGILVSLIPTNLFKAMVEMDILPIIIFSLLFGGAVSTLGRKGKPIVTFFDGVNEAIMKIIYLIMWFAPLGIFGLLAARLGKAGGLSGFMPEFIKLGKYTGCVILGLIIHSSITLPLILKIFGKRSVGSYLKNMLEALTTAFSTASSSATLPLTLKCVTEKNKISSRIASFVLPLGATINMDGTALYEAVAAMFIAQIYGLEMGLTHQIIIFITATLAAIGAAGIPEAGLVTMVIVLRAVKLPIEGITLILVIDWFLDRCRTTVNVWGDAVGAAVIERYESKAKSHKTMKTNSIN